MCVLGLDESEPYITIESYYRNPKAIQRCFNYISFIFVLMFSWFMVAFNVLRCSFIPVSVGLYF